MTDIDRPLPQNLEAERSILGAVLLDNDALMPALQITAAADFFLPQNRLIFSAMFDIADRGLAIDTITLMEELRRRGNLEGAGGVAYLSQLADGLPRVTNVDHYSRIVKEKAALRGLIHSAAAIQEQAFAYGEDADVILDRAQRVFAAIREKQSNRCDVLFDTWDEFQSARPLRSLIRSVLHAEVCNIVGGLSGDGKTLILFSITKALLTGRPLFGFFEVLEPVETVCYLIPECSRGPFFHRVKLFGLEKYVENGRLRARTLTKGPKIDLRDPRLLRAVRGSCVMIDTASRFGTGSENEAADVASGLAENIFGLLSAGAVTVACAHHSPKSFEQQSFITLENVLRGSGDFGAFVGAGFGIRQIDETANIIHLEDIKARDASPVPPFQIIGRPHIDEEGDFRMHRLPGDCGKLAEYLDLPGRNKGGAAPQAREARAANVALVRGWLRDEPNLTSTQLAARFKSVGVDVRPETVRGYKRELDE